MTNNSIVPSFIFWQRWLFYTSLVFALAGIGFALNGNNFIFRQYNEMLAEVFWHNSKFPPQAEPFRVFIYAPLGATITCCYILLAYISYYPFKDKQTWARNAIITAFSFWVIIDSVMCLYFGVYPQVYIINSFSIIIKALPIIFTWNVFKEKRKRISFVSE